LPAVTRGRFRSWRAGTSSRGIIASLKPKTLLADHNFSLLQIAIELGFADASSFSIAFRKMACLTPSAYRRSLL
jgi:hypothetical protein